MRVVDGVERRARLARRHCLTPATRAAGVEQAASAVVCLHATEPATVYLSAFARVEGLGVTDVDRALYTDRTLVKQLAMRRTLFAFPRELLAAAWGSASARVADQQRRQLARDVEKAGLARDGAAWVVESCRAVLEALSAHGPMSATSLREAVPALDARLTYAPDKAYGGSSPVVGRVLTVLAASGSVLRGDNDGGWRTSRPRWTLATDWLGEVPASLDEAAGYAELVRRWLRAFGPGSTDDLQWWLGSTVSAVRRALADVGAVQVRLEGDTTGHLLPDDEDPVAPVAPAAALLPALDATTMGWKARGFYLGPHAVHLFDSNGNAGQTAWWDGRVVGGWHQAPDGEVVVVPLEDVGAEALGALEQEAARLTAFLGGERVSSIYASPLQRRHTGP